MKTSINLNINGMDILINLDCCTDELANLLLKLNNKYECEEEIEFIQTERDLKNDLPF